MITLYLNMICNATVTLSIQWFQFLCIVSTKSDYLASSKLASNDLRDASLSS